MNEKTIILTVVSANNDLDTQELIKYAKEYNENSIIIFIQIDQVLNNSKGEDLYFKVTKYNIHKLKNYYCKKYDFRRI